MKSTTTRNITLIMAVTTLFAFPALAHKGATGIVKERMQAMVDMKDAMAVIGNMLKGKTDYSQQEAGAATGQLIRHGALVREQFPDTPESRQKASEATGLVWSDKARFDDQAEAFVMAAQALEAAIAHDDPDAIKATFRKTGQSCFGLP